MISKDQLNGLWESDRAVSPVVGVALLIAITVILAAVIGFVVLDTTDADSAASTDARMDFTGDASSGTVTIAHEGGDAINESNLVIRKDGDVVTPSVNNTDSDLVFETGESYEISVSGGETIAVVYDDPNSDRQNQLGTYEVPS